MTVSMSFVSFFHDAAAQAPSMTPIVNTVKPPGKAFLSFV